MIYQSLFRKPEAIPALINSNKIHLSRQIGQPDLLLYPAMSDHTGTFPPRKGEVEDLAKAQPEILARKGIENTAW